MIKLSANVSKKVPISGTEYSSQSYSAGIEVEVDSHANSEELKTKLHGIYGFLEKAIDEEIAGTRSDAPTRQHDEQRPVEQKPKKDGKSVSATQAQIKAIYAISKSRKMSKDDMAEFIFKMHKVSTPEELTLSQASEIIKSLKAKESVR